MLPSAYGLGQHFQDLGHSFSRYGPPSRQITYMYILLYLFFFFLSLGFAFGLLIFSFHTSGHKSGRDILPNIQTLFLENVA